MTERDEWLTPQVFVVRGKGHVRMTCLGCEGEGRTEAEARRRLVAALRRAGYDAQECDGDD